MFASSLEPTSVRHGLLNCGERIQLGPIFSLIATGRESQLPADSLTQAKSLLATLGALQGPLLPLWSLTWQRRRRSWSFWLCGIFVSGQIPCGLAAETCISSHLIAQGCHAEKRRLVRYALKKKKRHYLGIFPNMGGGSSQIPKLL